VHVHCENTVENDVLFDCNVCVLEIHLSLFVTVIYECTSFRRKRFKYSKSRSVIQDIMLFVCCIHKPEFREFRSQRVTSDLF